MSIISVDYGTISGGGSPNIVYFSGTWPSAGPFVISTTSKAYAVMFRDDNNQLWYAEQDYTYMDRNNSQVSSYPVAFSDSNITITGAYGANASCYGYIVYSS